MKRMTWLKGALALTVFSAASWAIAADHLDAPVVSADPLADITDLYTWTEAGNVIFALNVSPLAAKDAKFSDKVQYVIHTESAATFGSAGEKVDIICTFDAAQKISCWVGDQDYVTGDASATTGLTSTSKGIKVFAGPRDDPFFFNLDGFKDTVTTVKAVAGTLKFDAANCPTVDATTSKVLTDKLSTDPLSMPVGGAAKDFFAGKNVLSIVISVDKKLITDGGAIVSAWASTNKGS
ncbi:MAG: DUF4331 family protein [Byssovorax sp.]